MDKGSRGFILDNLFSMSAYWVCSGAIISSLTEYYGFSLPLSNFITGLTGTLPILQLAGGLAYGHTARPFRFLRCTNALWRFFLPLVFLSVLLPKGAGGFIMIVSYILAIGIFQFAASSQTSWMTSCVEKNAPQNYYSIREVSFMATYTGLFCLSSLVLEWSRRSGAHRTGFIFLGILSALMLVPSLFVLFRLPPPETPPKKAPFLTALAEPLRNRDFRRVMVAQLTWSFAGMFIGAFAALYQVRVLKVNFFQIMLWMTVGNTCRTLAIPMMAKLAARINWKRVTALCLGMMALSSVIWFYTTSQNATFFFPASTILSAIPFAGLGIGFLKMQIRTSPEDSRSVYLSVLSLLLGGAALLGSLLSSAMIRYLESFSLSALRFVFLVGALSALLAALLVFRVRYNKD